MVTSPSHRLRHPQFKSVSPRCLVPIRPASCGALPDRFHAIPIGVALRDRRAFAHCQTPATFRYGAQFSTVITKRRNAVSASVLLTLVSLRPSRADARLGAVGHTWARAVPRVRDLPASRSEWTFDRKPRIPRKACRNSFWLERNVRSAFRKLPKVPRPRQPKTDSRLAA